MFLHLLFLKPSPWPHLNCPEINSDLSCPSVFLFSSFLLSRCCCSSSRSRCTYLLCSPSSPLSCSLISAVRQLCLGGSHSIVLAPPSPIGARGAAGVVLTRSTLWKGLAPNHSDTWHFGVLGRLHLWLCVPFVHRQSSLHSLLQTAAILLLPALPVCPPLLHSNHLTQRFTLILPLVFCTTLSPSFAAQEPTVTLANLKWKLQTSPSRSHNKFLLLCWAVAVGYCVCSSNSLELTELMKSCTNVQILDLNTQNKPWHNRIKLEFPF